MKMKSVLFKLKTKIYSKNGMRIVNPLFFLSACLRGWISFVALLAWVVYLAYCITHTSSRISKTVFALLILFATAIFCMNIYVFFK